MLSYDLSPWQAVCQHTQHWVVKRSCAWKTLWHRLVRDNERLPTTVTGLHLVAFGCLLLQQALALVIAPIP